MTQEMKDVINSEYKHIVLQAYAGCVDKNTEYFNGDGWKRISEYSLGDKVLQYTRDGVGELVYPKRYIDEPCDTFVKIKTKFSDMMLSEDHRFVYLDDSREVKKENLLVESADQIYVRHHKTKNGFTGKIITDFRLKADKELNIKEDMLRLIIAVCSDGVVIKDDVRMNLKRQVRRDRLESLLSKCCIDYKKEGTNYTFKLEGATKRIPKEWMYLKESLKKIVIEEYVLWVCSTKRYFSNHKEDIDIIQFIAHTVGYRANIHVNERLGEAHRSSYRLTFDSNPLVGFLDRRSDKTKTMEKIRVEDGRQYCFTVPSGFLVLRRNGKIFVTGNCGKTTTIAEYIKEHPHENILYMVFSAEMKREAERRFGKSPNCTIKTFHGLCYSWFVNNNRGGRFKDMSNQEIMKQFRNVSQLELKALFSRYDLEFEDLKKIQFYYDYFLASDKVKPSDLQLIVDDDSKYIPFVERLWEYHNNSHSTIPHNFYLKKYSLTNPNAGNYDTILADEFQDTSDAVRHIITSNLDKKIIAVGDGYQNIMGFSFSKNSLKDLRDDYDFKEYKLTKSFRIGDQLANMCGRLLTWFYEENITFEGVNVSKVGKIDLNTIEEQVLVVCRTRMGVLLDSLSILDKRPEAKFYYGGGLDSYDLKEVENILKYNGSIYIEGQRYHITELRKMKKEGLSDVVINGIISRYDFIKKHTDALTLLRNSETKDRKQANFVMSTLHGVKGGEAEYVKFGSDIGGVKQLKEKYMKRKEEGVAFLISEIENELNLLYVGLSRATKVLDIGDSFVKEDKLATQADVRKDGKLKTKTTN